MKKAFLLFFILLAMGNKNIAQTNMTIETSPDGNEYLLYLPDGYDAANEYPMILYLHGAQAIGNNISKSFGKGLPGAINNDDVLSDSPFIVVAPHAKGEFSNDYQWNMDSVAEILDYAEQTYSLAADRIFGVGISLGAKGIWDFALDFPNKFAGIMPISGNSFLTNICSLNEVAIWALHGDSDGLIPINDIDNEGNQTGRFGSQVLVDTISRCTVAPDFPPKLTIFKAKGHNGWDQVFDLSSGYNAYEWMEAITKGVTTGYAPLVSAGDNRSFIAGNQTFRIKSFALDPDGHEEDLQYNWQQLSGPSQTFQNNNSILSVDLSTVGSFTFRLTVSDLDGNSTTDEVTIDVLDSDSGPQVKGLKFFYDGNFVQDITGDYAIDITTYDDPDLINIAADTANLNDRASVRFALDDNNNFATQNDNKITTNYLIGGENGTLFKPANEESYTIVATAFGNRNAQDQGVSFQSTISFTSSPLPVELVSFSANRDGDRVTLRWTTAEEIDNSHFEIYQGIENTTEMEMIAEVAGAGTTESLKHYEYVISPAPSCGQLFYQLKDVDYDGNKESSKVISASGFRGDCKVSLYPNPNNTNTLNLQGDILYNGVKIKVHSATGGIIARHEVLTENQEASIDISALTPGLYYLQIGQVFRKFIVE